MAKIIDWRLAEESREPLDLFVSRDNLVADSVVNGSRLSSESSLTDLLGAVMLWSRTLGMSNDESIPWLQEFRTGVAYKMTIVPTDFSAALEMLPQELERMGLPNTLLGTDWASVASRCADIMVASLNAASKLGLRAKNLSRSAAYPLSEYDAQNLFFLTLKPWLPDLEYSPFLVSYGGQQKFADFAAAQSKLVVEIKYVYDRGSAASVVKQLAGLAALYELAPTTEAIIFAVVVAYGVPWDSAKIDSTHTRVERRPVILTRSMSLPELRNSP